MALDGVSLGVEAGEIHALLGPNGAGKTTLLRILAGLQYPSAGTVRVLGVEPTRGTTALRQRIGLVPSGDRTFYLRISGLENLLFFARLHGLRRKQAVERARDVLEQVDLLDAARVRVGVYSHGMQKRLSLARALLVEPALFLIDEATHDLDPESARRIRALVRGIADRGAAVVWATQRVDEIRGFVERVTLLNRGKVRFDGSVPELIAHAVPRSYFVRLRNGHADAESVLPRLEQVLAGVATIQAAAVSRSDSYVLSLSDDVVLGDALARLHAANMTLLSCHEERSEIEEAFISLTRGSSA